MKITSILALAAKSLKAFRKSVWLSMFDRASSIRINSGFEISEVAKDTLSFMPRLSLPTLPLKHIPRLDLISDR